MLHLQARLKFKPHDRLTLLELRAWRLPAPALVPYDEAQHGGCVSWVKLPLAASLFAAAAPALSDAEFAARQVELRARLARLPVEPLDLPPASG